MPIKVQDPTLPLGTKPGHLQFAADGFYGHIASPSSGNNGPNIFSPRHPNFQRGVDGHLKWLSEAYFNDDEDGQTAMRIMCADYLFGIYKNEDPSFNHPELAVEARKFFDRVKATIPIWEDDTFEEIINHLRWRKIRAEQASGYSQGD